MRATLVEIDDARREALLHRAAEVVRAEAAVIPLHHEAAVWATRRGILYAARADTLTYATDVRPA
jgi:peptide/nickel transport system substrate-binding protein